jgi:hypothetical protein
VEFFAYPDPLVTFQHLEPAQLSGDDVFHMLKLISDAQMKNEASPLKFVVMVEILNDLTLGDEIEEIVNPPPSSTKAKKSHGKEKAKATDTVTVDFSPAFCKPNTEGADTTTGNTDLSGNFSISMDMGDGMDGDTATRTEQDDCDDDGANNDHLAVPSEAFYCCS